MSGNIILQDVYIQNAAARGNVLATLGLGRFVRSPPPVSPTPILTSATLITSPPLVSNNGSNGITFEIIATKNIIVTNFSCTFSNTVTQTALIWYRVGGVLHSDASAPNITTQNGWVLLENNITVTSLSSLTPTNIPRTYNLSFPANTPVGFFIGSSPGVRYQSLSAGTTNFTDSTLTILCGTGKGFGGSVPLPNFTPRGFLGSVTYLS